MPKLYQETVIVWVLNINFTLIINSTGSIIKAPSVIQVGFISDLHKLNKQDKIFNKILSFSTPISWIILKLISLKEFGLYNSIINKKMSMYEISSGQDIMPFIDSILLSLEAYILETVLRMQIYPLWYEDLWFFICDSFKFYIKVNIMKGESYQSLGLWAIGVNFFWSGPMYLDMGLISFLLFLCSIIWAAHPEVLEITKIGVKKSLCLIK